jgi:hypothetical protein
MKGLFIFNKGFHMNILRLAVFSVVMLLSVGAGAQITKDPTTWTVEVKKTGATAYDVIFHLKLQPTWHIWSLTPGGDGFQLPPEFKLDKVAGVKLVGKVKEKGKLIKSKMDGVDGVVNYYSGSVDYVQSVTATGVAKITGSYRYQVCTDAMCLPPKTKKFEVAVK